MDLRESHWLVPPFVSAFTTSIAGDHPGLLLLDCCIVLVCLVYEHQATHTATAQMVDLGASTVTVTFDPMATGTRLTIRHEGTASESGRRGVGDGWTRAMVSLKKRIEPVDGSARS